MKRHFLWIFCALMFTGCAFRITPDEEAFLREVAGHIREKIQVAEMEGFDYSMLDRGASFFSHHHNPEKTPMPVFTRSDFWFKVSLSKDPVDANQSPMPVLSMFIPSLNKFIQLRVRGENDELTRTLVEVVYEAAAERGGEDPRIELINSRENTGFGGRRRRMAF